jgi:hypothetical protein
LLVLTLDALLALTIKVFPVIDPVEIVSNAI